MSKLTKRITAMLLAGMLVIGSAPGSVLAASTDEDSGQTSEIAQEVYDEESSEEPAAAGETAEEAIAEEEAVVQYYTVTLDANGGYFENEWDDAIGEIVEQSEVVEKHIPADGTVAAFPVFTDQDGQTMIFAGWSLERDGELVSEGDEVYAPVDSCTLFAVWQVEDALGDTEGQEVADEGNTEQIDAAQETEEIDAEAEEELPLYISSNEKIGENIEEESIPVDVTVDDYRQDEVILKNDKTLDSTLVEYDEDSDQDNDNINEEAPITAKEFYTDELTSEENVNSPPLNIADSVFYTVTFDACGGYFETDDNTKPEIVSVSVQEGRTVHIPTVLTDDEERCFCGWSLEKNGEIISRLEATGDCTVYAIWGYFITLDANGGYFRGSFYDSKTDTSISEPESFTKIVREGDAIELPPEAFILNDDESKKFIGWSLTEDGVPVVKWDEEDYLTTRGKAFYDTEQKCTLYAVWTENFYTVTLVANGGRFNQTRNNAYGNMIAATANGNILTKKIVFGNTLYLDGPSDLGAVVPTNEDRTFLGWGYSRSGNPISLEVNSDGMTCFIPTEDCKLYALWAQEVEEIILDKKSISISESFTDKLTAYVFPSNAQNKSLTWKSSDPNVATVNADGIVTGVSKGTATITVLAADGYGARDICEVTVESSSLSAATVTGFSAKTYSGKPITQALTVTLGSTILTCNTDYTISYSNNIDAGTATVTITGKGKYTGTKTATFKINKAAQSITAKAVASPIAVGKTTTVSISGAKGTKSFKSSDTTIAAVSSIGKVTAKKVGKVTITVTSAATANYKAASKTVTIKVVPAATASLTAENQATGIKLTWKKVAGANAYFIYHGSTQIAAIKNGSTVTYTDEKATSNGKKYTYKIIASASSTGRSTLSKSATTYCVTRPAISTLTNSAASKMTAKWGKNAKATGYQIQYCPDKTFKTGNKSVSINSASTVSKVIGGLTKGKTYYVRVRTYKTAGSTKYFSAWSAVKNVKITK